MPTLTDLSRLLPVPGPVWGGYPLRSADDTAPPWRRPRLGGPLACSRRAADAAVPEAASWQALDAAAQAAALSALRLRLRREGLQGQALAQALGVVSAQAQAVLGTAPRATQRLAAAALLDNRMAEMATGEGKTLAIALAAAVAALAGVPVHVATANDYLAARDAAALGPLFASLGLSATSLPGTADDALRRRSYGHDIVYTTARELAFDFLRDRLDGGAASEPERCAAALDGRAAPALRLRGLCLALLDEADSILLDEAGVPLILSRAVPQAARRAFLWQALALARQLDAGSDFLLHPADRVATLTAVGEQRVAALAQGLGGPWQRTRYRREVLTVALAGLHLFHRNEHYVVRDGAIELLDEVSGRIAVGRVWSRGLQTVVALKEGLAPPAETETIAQTTFQRFFQRYWRLGGISGTLWEARSELKAVYGTGVVRIALHRPCRRVRQPDREFDDPDALFDAAASRAAALAAAGRPVLLGTDSVADSQALSSRLVRQGVAHRVLNALHDADEAAIVAAAGRSGSVTVATRMAGRGTDIALDDAARAAGGLHVLSCQHNASRRLDRQLAGRAGRQGDPGSAEAWSLRRTSASLAPPVADKLELWKPSYNVAPRPVRMPLRRRWVQWCEERRQAASRRSLLEQDRQWDKRLSFAGPPG